MNINWPRAVARRVLSLSMAPRLTVFCAIFCASLISMPAVAQDSTGDAESLDTDSRHRRAPDPTTHRRLDAGQGREMVSARRHRGRP